ncbi:halocyanin domain-containing protein [Halogeometricum sp. S1BR25-6]|uniref:Halocyanin domain-containing protein n=1 Tax=Halogeometricum salsisoli TaxID=2950536 RepID=A0ABU2GAG7_9EURY|nr:halocyanin domain-containing protein [Halogeometricum sp. S1BR25-6]MDS0297807.1 halocyanin domain-containing protein [Halogeometricum sp. S1BR25-6]
MTDCTRRDVLAGTGALVGAGLVGGPLLARPVRAAEETDLTEWFAKTDGADAVVDATGEDEVVVKVGSPGNGGDFGFSPVAVRVDPGVTVTWEWTGAGGSHNVVAEDGSFESEYYSEAGATFSTEAPVAGVVPYACAPHSAMGMRGALVVGDAAVALPGGSGGENGPADGASDDGDAEKPSFDGWLDRTDNYDGVADRRGESEVTVEVGAMGNGGEFAFEPAAIRVDPGTTVVWEWVGTAGAYDVVDDELGYASERVRGTDHEFALAFDGDGLSKYECTTYGDRGMRGVVFVGEGPVDTLTPTGVAAVAGTTGLLAAVGAAGLRLHLRTSSQYDPNADR